MTFLISNRGRLCKKVPWYIILSYFSFVKYGFRHYVFGALLSVSTTQSILYTNQ